MFWGRQWLHNIEEIYYKLAVALASDKEALNDFKICVKHVSNPANHMIENLSVFRKVNSFIYL